MEGSGAAIVRFRAPSGVVVGHGVLVDDEHVVTCAHVVNAALGRQLRSTDDARGQILRLEFPLLAQLTALAPERRARVDAWEGPGTAFDGLDVAGLTLVGEPRPIGAIPVPLAGEGYVEGDVLLFGPVEGRPGGWVSARLRPWSSSTGSRSISGPRALTWPSLATAVHRSSMRRRSGYWAFW